MQVRVGLVMRSSFQAGSRSTVPDSGWGPPPGTGRSDDLGLFAGLDDLLAAGVRGVTHLVVVRERAPRGSARAGAGPRRHGYRLSLGLDGRLRLLDGLGGSGRLRLDGGRRLGWLLGRGSAGLLRLRSARALGRRGLGRSLVL